MWLNDKYLKVRRNCKLSNWNDTRISLGHLHLKWTRPTWDDLSHWQRWSSYVRTLMGHSKPYGGGGVFHKAFFVINNKNVNDQIFIVIGGKLLSMTKFSFIKANDKSRSRKCILIVVIEPNNNILSSALVKNDDYCLYMHAMATHGRGRITVRACTAHPARWWGLRIHGNQHHTTRAMYM